ncbi:hypothetical protein N9464_03725 [Flavobacteriaceae bacterium]|nr:hypothetical protein [Flavobacteriaceae bacterium]
MGRPAGSPNKLTAEIKEKLANILDEAINSLDIKTMTKSERLKLIQITLQYVLPRLKQVKEDADDMPTHFQIEVIESRSQLSEKEIDNNYI